MIYVTGAVTQSTFTAVNYPFNGERQGARAREKRGREGYGRREEKEQEAGFLKWGEPGEKEKSFAILHNILQEPLQKGAGSGSKRYGRREFHTPLSPPTFYHGKLHFVSVTDIYGGKYPWICQKDHTKRP